MNKCRGNREMEKSSLEHHSNNCCRQDPLKNAENKGQNFKDKWDICIVSKYLPQNIYFCGGFHKHLQIL